MHGLEAFVRLRAARVKMATVTDMDHVLPWNVSASLVGKVTTAVSQSAPTTAIVSYLMFLHSHNYRYLGTEQNY